MSMSSFARAASRPELPTQKETQRRKERSANRLDNSVTYLVQQGWFASLALRLGGANLAPVLEPGIVA